MTGLMCSHPRTSLEILLGLSLPQSLTATYLSPQKSETNLSLSGLHFILLESFAPFMLPTPSGSLLVSSEILSSFWIPQKPFNLSLSSVRLSASWGQNQCGIQLCSPRHLAQGMVLFHLLTSNPITHPLAKMADENWGETHNHAHQKEESHLKSWGHASDLWRDLHGKKLRSPITSQNHLASLWQH